MMGSYCIYSFNSSFFALVSKSSYRNLSISLASLEEAREISPTQSSQSAGFHQPPFPPLSATHACMSRQPRLPAFVCMKGVWSGPHFTGSPLKPIRGRGRHLELRVPNANDIHPTQYMGLYIPREKVAEHVSSPCLHKSPPPTKCMYMERARHTGSLSHDWGAYGA